MIERLLDPLLKALESGSWGVVFLLVAVAVIVNLRPILEFLERRESRREEFVKAALQVDAVAGAARAFLEEELNYLLFKRVTCWRTSNLSACQGQVAPTDEEWEALRRVPDI